MNYLKRPFRLGDKVLPSNIFYAPLAGCSDLPFRRLAAHYGAPGLTFCEMVKMEALIRNDSNTFRLLDFEPDMHPAAAQLCGSNPKIAGQAARILEDMGFQVIDLNCGCPVDKVTKDNSGSGMLRTPELIGEVLIEMVAAVKVPVTVKIRAGWDENSINGPLITQIAEKAGAKIITVHGRTRKQAYQGPANWDFIRDCKDAANDILVFGNGSLFTAEDGKKMFEHTNCDGLVIARGTFGQPWIAREIYQLLGGEELLAPSPKERKEGLSRHFEEILRYHNDYKALREMRRVGCWYIKKAQNTRKFRGSISKASSLDEVRSLIQNFDWDEDEKEPEEAESVLQGATS